MRKLLSIAILALVTACQPATDDTGSSGLFDPRQPGAVIGVPTGVDNVSNVVADASVAGKVTLTWTMPLKYRFLAYKLFIYRRACNTSSASCTVDQPTAGSDGSSVYKVYSTPDASPYEQTYADTSVSGGITYSYFLYARLNGVWSSLIAKTVTTTAPTVSYAISDPTQFWKSINMTILRPPSGSESLTMQHALPGSVTEQTQVVGPPTTFSASNAGKGRFAIAKGGTYMYYADTDRNRVLILSRSANSNCDSISDADAKAACFWGLSSNPFSSVNVLGQPDQYSSRTCAQWNAYCPTLPSQSSCEANSFCDWNSGSGTCSFTGQDKCMTSPKGVTVDGDSKLIVSDSGNNRVLVYNTLPDLNACDTSAFVGASTTYNCAASTVIGKKSFSDFATYSVATDGASSLDNPGDILVKDGDMFIADTNNNRVVKIRNYASWSCSSSLWLIPGCAFSMVLGQADFNSKLSLVNFDENDASFFSAAGSGNTISASYTGTLKRYFANPVAMSWDQDGNLAIAAYEGFSKITPSTLPMTLKSRILTFPYSKISGSYTACNAATFGTTTSCDASFVIGQDDFDTIPLQSSAVGTYADNVSYGLTYITGLTFIGTQLLASDASTNNIYLWTDWKNNSYVGRRYNSKIEDPAGATNPNNAFVSLPDLSSISGIYYNSTNYTVLVSDPGLSKVFEIKLTGQ